ncbi:stage II sporulation protein M [Desulfovibrio sp. OttesenSCG-928-O18]|nr:stage II sporulation protein M [Desulfovibrio sp. OttesenSCG-928-O18]
MQEGAMQREALVLRSAEFRKGRERGWRQLDEMVSRVEKEGVGALSAEEVRQLPLLYRATMSSLSVARTIVLDRNLLLYLENLALRAYLVVYGPRSGVLRNMAEFFRRGFPRAVRGMRWHLAIAFVLVLAGLVAGYVLVKNDMIYFNILVPEGLAGGRGPGSSAQDLIKEELFAPWPGFVETFIVFANSLFQHNTIVGIFCFGLGFALGVPTIFLLIYNGLILGAFIALHAERGLTVDFIGWLMIHGVTELLAILLCGAAGLVVAQKILFPGQLPRLESLARYGKRAASVVAGSVALFFIAGFLEGGFRQLINNTPGRYAFAIATAALWFGYFFAVGRGGKHGDPN